MLLRERHHMDGGPEPEGYKPAETDSTRLQDGEIFPDYRHVPFVKVAKGTRRTVAFENRRNKAADIPTLLDRNLRDARQRPSALRGSGRIADDEYLRLIR